MPSSLIAVINANTKRIMRATLKNITQFISQQMQSSGIIVINANTKRNITKTLNDIREFISQQMLFNGLAVITDKCKYKTKRTYNKKHLSADAVQWFCCDKCEFKTKRNHCLKQHKKYLVCLKRKVLPKNNVEERLK
jgi:hypothetical protein